MTVKACIDSGGHKYYDTGRIDSLNRQILICSKCSLPIYETVNKAGLLEPGDMHRIEDLVSGRGVALRLVG